MPGVIAGPPARSSWFQRFLLPGLAFKAVVIGGGYATGRELAEFFLPSGPWGGVYGMALAMAIWSAVCVTTFLFARRVGAEDYKTFFRALLGPFWIVYEIVYILFIILILAVFAASAGAIGEAVLGWPPIAGSLCLIGAIAMLTTLGNEAVERLFKYAAPFIYAVYALFLILALTSFGDRIAESFARPIPTDGWAAAGLSYAGYNVIGAVIILPVLRHLASDRDALVAGVIAGPLAMIPALLFFISMAAYHPAIAGETLPSDFLLSRMNAPGFDILFQLMIFIALLDTGAPVVNAINERAATAWRARRGSDFPAPARLALAAVILAGSAFLATRFGLVTLIAEGYRAFAWILLAVFVLPLMTYGVWRLWRVSPSTLEESQT